MSTSLSASFVLEAAVAVAVALFVVRFWKAILVALAVTVLALAGVGAMTVAQHLGW